MPETYHEPVLAGPIGELARGARRVVDGTLGDGGHTRIFLAQGAQVLGIDRDPDALARAHARLGDPPALRYLQAVFSSPEALAAIRDFHPDFILLDLGVSSRQLDDPDRGFTTRPGAPLDMRMGPESESAAEFLATRPEAELERVFREYGDERKAGALARAVVRRRQQAPLAASDDLVNAIRAVLGPRSGPDDFARIFQAVRIAVNRELEGLASALPSLRDALTPVGRLAVISYHSGEDRIVKHQFQEWARRCICPPRQPVCTCRGRPLGTMDPRKPIRPTPMEIAANPRARSARLRVFQVAHAA